jgi:hypothetical protein
MNCPVCKESEVYEGANIFGREFYQCKDEDCRSWWWKEAASAYEAHISNYELFSRN